ncbi:MAG: DUF4304 domain-containing protein [Spirochaetales bacterium]|nr:DUF4304 domain-containing protein [Spirochaetales bacterium]
MKQFSAKPLKEIALSALKEYVYPLLIAKGFKKTGGFFYRLENNIIKHFEIEFNRWNSFLLAGFSLYCGISFGDFSAVNKIDKNILFETGKNIFYDRIGSLWGESAHEYSVATEDHVVRSIQQTGKRVYASADQLGPALIKDLNDHVFPYFDDITTLDSAVGFLKKESEKNPSQYAFRCAVLLADLGRKTESRKYFLLGMVPGNENTIRKAAASHGVELQ